MRGRRREEIRRRGVLGGRIYLHNLRIDSLSGGVFRTSVHFAILPKVVIPNSTHRLTRSNTASGVLSFSSSTSRNLHVPTIVTRRTKIINSNLRSKSLVDNCLAFLPTIYESGYGGPVWMKLKLFYR